MKNLKGCLAIESKKKFHKQDLGRLVALLNARIKSSLTVLDGIYTNERGPDALGIAYRTDLLVAGRDVFACDVVGAELMGIRPEDVDHLRAYGALTGRSSSLEAVHVKGEALAEVARPLEWRLADDEVFHRAGIRGLSVAARRDEEDLTCCSGCGTILSAFAAVFCKDNPGVRLNGVQICMGEKARPNPDTQKVFLLGNCAIAANRELPEAVRIKGCPPPVLNTVTALVAKTLPRRRAARILTVRMVKNLGIKLGIYDEAFPAFGHYQPPEFDRRHF
jgi:hypothetical protein